MSERVCVCLVCVSEEEVGRRSVGRSSVGRSAGAAPKVRTPHNDVGNNELLEPRMNQHGGGEGKSKVKDLGFRV